MTDGPNPLDPFPVHKDLPGVLRDVWPNGYVVTWYRGKVLNFTRLQGEALRHVNEKAAAIRAQYLADKGIQA